MTPTTIAIVAVLTALALIAWACAWQTLNWLGDAEDLIERMAGVGDSKGYRELERYKRRTPRRGR